MSSHKLLLLHGALGGREQFTPLSDILSQSMSVYSLNMEGHGGVQQPDRPFRIQYFAEGVIEWMDRFGHKQVNIFGYSMGGYVALYMALHYPDRVGKIFTLGTKFFWNKETAEKESARLNPELILEKVPAYGEILRRRHTSPNDWKLVLEKTSDLMFNLAQKPAIDSLEIKRIINKVRIGVGDRDEMVSIQETQKLSALIPDSEFMVLPGTHHPLDKINTGRLAAYIRDFLEN